MKPIDFNKYKFKLRSLPNAKTFPRYVEYYTYFFLFYIIYSLIDVCLFSNKILPTIPSPFVIAIPIVFIHVYTTLESERKSISRDTFKEVVVHIRLKQSESLIRKLEDNPELLNGSFDKKSLLYWARYYKNTHANSIIIEQMKNQSKERSRLT